MKGTKRLAVLAMFTAIALTIFVAEAQIPPVVPIPGVKLGLANIVTLIAMALLGRRQAGEILLVRIVLGSVFTGGVSAMLFSIAGGVLAYLVKPVKESNLFPAMEIALSRWEEMQDLSAELDKVRDTLEMRKTLDRAKGILMAVHHLTEKEAYRRIQQYAMAKRLTVKEVAEAIVRAAVK